MVATPKASIWTTNAIAALSQIARSSAGVDQTIVMIAAVVAVSAAATAAKASMRFMGAFGLRLPASGQP
jgi:hypothetical protein